MAQNTYSGKLEDHQPPSLLRMELQTIDRFSESSRPQVHQEVVTVRGQLEKKEQDPDLSSQSERRRSQRFRTKNKIDKLTKEDIGFVSTYAFQLNNRLVISAFELDPKTLAAMQLQSQSFVVNQRNYQEEKSYK